MSTYEISKSSLLSLKAEILRKQEEVIKNKNNNEAKLQTLKKNRLELKNKGVEQRQTADLTGEEEDLLKKSKNILEEKAKLYDKLANKSRYSSEEKELNRRFLVRFDKKKKKVSDLPPEDSSGDDLPREEDERDDDIYHSDKEAPKDPSEEWVEYVDCLGRTRKCLRKDLEHFKSNDKNLKEIVEAKKREKGESIEEQTKPFKERIEEKKKEELEQDKKSDRDSPEKNLDENELLSSDMRREILRKQWEKEEEALRDKDDIHYQDILFNEARTHGVGYYGFSKDEVERAQQQENLKKLREETQAQQKRSQELKAMREKQMAARIKAAKNRKRERLGLPPEEEVESEPAQALPSEEQIEEQERQRLEEEKNKIEEEKKKHLRPWDIGKEALKVHQEYSQDEWVKKKRSERDKEFAPPSSYHSRRDRRRRRHSSSSSSSSFSSDSEDEKYKPRSRRERREEKSINPYKRQEDDEDRLMRDFRGAGNSKNIDVEVKKGAEIPPPAQMDYYLSGNSKNAVKRPSESIEESIEAGLRYFRSQVEKKSKTESNRRDDDIFLD